MAFEARPTGRCPDSRRANNNDSHCDVVAPLISASYVGASVNKSPSLPGGVRGFFISRTENIVFLTIFYRFALQRKQKTCSPAPHAGWPSAPIDIRAGAGKRADHHAAILKISDRVFRRPPGYRWSTRSVETCVQSILEGVFLRVSLRARRLCGESCFTSYHISSLITWLNNCRAGTAEPFPIAPPEAAVYLKAK